MVDEIESLKKKEVKFLAETESDKIAKAKKRAEHKNKELSNKPSEN